MANPAVKAANEALDEQVDQALRSLKKCVNQGATYRHTIRSTFAADVKVDRTGRVTFAGGVEGVLPQLPAGKVGLDAGMERETTSETVAKVTIESNGEITYDPPRNAP